MIALIKRAVNWVKSKFQRGVKKKPLTTEKPQKVVRIDIYKNGKQISVLRSSDRNQSRNYSDIIKYVDHYDFETIYDLDRNIIELYLIPKKNDVLELKENA